MRDLQVRSTVGYPAEGVPHVPFQFRSRRVVRSRRLVVLRLCLRGQLAWVIRRKSDRSERSHREDGGDFQGFRKSCQATRRAGPQNGLR